MDDNVEQEAARNGWQDPEKQGKSCKVYLLDLSDVATTVGVPTCNLANFSADSRSAMLLMEPRAVGIPVPEPRNAKDASAWPWAAESHLFAQTSAPWYAT